MCRGIEERSRHGSSSEAVDSVVNNVVFCELCGSRAALYCQADDAYLCRKCDKWVHSANILALRHIRCVLCETCQNHTRRYLIGASPAEVALPTVVSFRLAERKSDCSLRAEKNCSRLQSSSETIVLLVVKASNFLRFQLPEPRHKWWQDVIKVKS